MSLCILFNTRRVDNEEFVLVIKTHMKGPFLLSYEFSQLHVYIG